MGGQYSIALVLCSVGIAVLASYAALDMATSVAVARGWRRLPVLAAGSVAMGAGIWSMHFTGMLAFHLPFSLIRYEITLVIASIVVAILASIVALGSAMHEEKSARLLLLGSVSMGIAIAGMHYTGMAAMRTAAHVDWSMTRVIASFIIAVSASFVALHLVTRVGQAARASRFKLKMIGAVVMGIAISGMHYTGMSAAHFTPAQVAFVHTKTLLATPDLAIAVVATTILILIIAIGTSRMRVREQYYRALIENSQELIVIVDAQGRRSYVSPSYARVLGYRPENLIGQNAFDFIHPDDESMAREKFAALISEPGGHAEADIRVRTVDGDYRILHANGHNLLDDPAVRGVVLTSRDETERRRLEEQFRQAQKMEAVGTLAGGIAHDFNNLLTVVIGNVEMLRTDLPPNSNLTQLLREVDVAANRAAALTQQLLAFGRRQLLRPRAISLNKVIGYIEPMLTRVLGERIFIKTSLNQDLWTVMVDPSQVEQMLMNLCINARDAMPNGGVIEIETSNVYNPDGECDDIGPIPPGEYVAVCVTDVGSGIPPEAMSHIFEPFFTTKERAKRTGLGLATVYGIMRQSGGCVSVRSEVGTGSTFTLYFPRYYALSASPFSASH